MEDVNDNYPLTSEPVYRAEVTENSEAGTLVTRVSATDRDGAGPLTYSIAAGNPQSLFSIDSETGESRSLFSIHSETAESRQVSDRNSSAFAPETEVTWPRRY